jgi:hypothetical protein
MLPTTEQLTDRKLLSPQVPTADGEKDLVVKMECSPINPSDLGVS